MLNYAVPLIFTGLGFALAFKASCFNLGGEGQFYCGAWITTNICLYFTFLYGYIGICFALIGSGIFGGILAGLSGYFKMKWKTNELISSFLISATVIHILHYFVTGPMRDFKVDLQATKKIPEHFQLQKFFSPSYLNTSIFLALFCVGVIYFLVYYTRWGYEMRMTGLNEQFSYYGGINTSRYIWLPMLISGALHSIAGCVWVLGTHHRTFKDFSMSGMGWNGIAVALIAKGHPIAIIFSALFYSYLVAGIKAATLASDITPGIAVIVQSSIFYVITAKGVFDLLRAKGKKI